MRLLIMFFSPEAQPHYADNLTSASQSTEKQREHYVLNYSSTKTSFWIDSFYLLISEEGECV